MVDDPNLPPPVIADDGASQPSVAEPVSGVRIVTNAEDDEREALTAADYAAAGVEAPDWANDPFPDLDTWRKWQAAQSKALAFKRANAGK